MGNGAYNLISSPYSLNQTSQTFIPESLVNGVIPFNNGKQIDLGSDYALFGDIDAMFEIKFPERDIKVRIKRSSTVTEG